MHYKDKNEKIENCGILFLFLSYCSMAHINEKLLKIRVKNSIRWNYYSRYCTRCAQNLERPP